MTGLLGFSIGCAIAVIGFLVSLCYLNCSSNDVRLNAEDLPVSEKTLDMMKGLTQKEIEEVRRTIIRIKLMQQELGHNLPITNHKDMI